VAVLVETLKTTPLMPNTEPTTPAAEVAAALFSTGVVTAARVLLLFDMLTLSQPLRQQPAPLQ
jgi:hypothetical protein